MNDKEMSEMFSQLLEQIKKTNENMSVLVNALNKNSDILHQNSIICKNLEKIELNLGAVMAQGLSANANVQVVDRALGFFLKYLGK